LSIHSQRDLFNFIIIAYGIHPSCGHAHLQGGSYTNKVPDQGSSCPRTFWGLIHQGTRPRINPCPRHGYPEPCPRHGYPEPCPGALDISRDFNCLVPDQEPQPYTGGPLRVFTVWSQTKNPSYILGALTRVFCCLVPDQEPQLYIGGPNKGLLPWH
jgi:hypothetical protein